MPLQVHFVLLSHFQLGALTFYEYLSIRASQLMSATTFIVATDEGIFYKMQQMSPQKQFYIAPTAGNGGGDCRRGDLCQTGHGARPRGPESRDLGVLSATGRAHAAGSPVERSVLAQAGCGAASGPNGWCGGSGWIRGRAAREAVCIQSLHI